MSEIFTSQKTAFSLVATVRTTNLTSEVSRSTAEVCGFDSWCHWNFSLISSFRPHYGPGVDSASNKNYQEYFLGGKGGRCVRLTNLLPSCADCHEVSEPHPPGTLRARPGQYRNCCTFYHIHDANLSDGVYSTLESMTCQYSSAVRHN
jgi:hypothetical protein